MESKRHCVPDNADGFTFFVCFTHFSSLKRIDVKTSIVIELNIIEATFERPSVEKMLFRTRWWCNDNYLQRLIRNFNQHTLNFFMRYTAVMFHVVLDHVISTAVEDDGGLS